jgi:hypothetical protein
LPVGELEDSFTALLGRQPTDREKQSLYRVRDALKLKPTDAVWQLLMALQHYETLYEAFPARIAEAARDVTKTVRDTALAEAQSAAAQTKRALAVAVQEAAVASAKRAAGAQLWKWVSIAATIATLSVAITAWWQFSRGERAGIANGWTSAMKQCGSAAEAASWANTPEGQLAYKLAQVGSLRDLATCTGRGMVRKESWCLVPSERGRPVARWPVPTDTPASTGENP